MGIPITLKFGIEKCSGYKLPGQIVVTKILWKIPSSENLGEWKVEKLPCLSFLQKKL